MAAEKDHCASCTPFYHHPLLIDGRGWGRSPRSVLSDRPIMYKSRSVPY